MAGGRASDGQAPGAKRSAQRLACGRAFSFPCWGTLPWLLPRALPVCLHLRAFPPCPPGGRCQAQVLEGDGESLPEAPGSASSTPFPPPAPCDRWFRRGRGSQPHLAVQQSHNCSWFLVLGKMNNFSLFRESFLYRIQIKPKKQAHPEEPATCTSPTSPVPWSLQAPGSGSLEGPVGLKPLW